VPAEIDPLLFTVQSIDGSHLGSMLPSEVPVSPVSAVGEAPRIPQAYAIGPAIPNPVFRSTMIELSVPRDGAVVVDLFDVAGRRVRSLLDARLEPGMHAVRWDGCDSSGQPAPAGVYYARMQAPGIDRSVGLVLVR
jgi:flagellar hook assembly protein FlgD